MLKPRWWDVTVVAGSMAIALGLVFGFGPVSQPRQAIALACIALFVLGYVLIGRASIGNPPAGWRFPAFLAVAALAVGVGSAAAPLLAMLQTLAYPLVWVIGDTRSRGIFGSLIIGLSVFSGFFIGGDFTAGAALSGATTATFSVVFATGLGLWIASIAEYGEERARLLADLTAAQGEVEALSRDRGAAAERERMARDIHDTLAQTLAGLVILAERAAGQARAGEQDAAATTIATVEQVARDALHEARALVARTAAVPSEPAFEGAVERLVERFRAQGAARIALEVHAGEGGLERDAQVVLLRCLQEALSNVSKHAGADRVTVLVTTDQDGSSSLVVTDDGAGFDVDLPRHGFGLDGMAERVGLAGGSLRVERAAGGGTALHVSLPGARVRVGGAA